jgi:hypothetical protein
MDDLFELGHVAPLVRVDVSGEEFGGDSIARWSRHIDHGPTHHGAGALEEAVGRRHRGVDQQGRFGRRPTEQLGDDQDGALAWAEGGEGSYEEQFGRLSRRHGVGGIATDASGRRSAVGVRLEVPVALQDVGHVAHDGRPSLVPLEVIEAGVGGDRVEPRAHRCAFLERRTVAPRLLEGQLRQLFGIPERAGHAVAVHVQLVTMACERRLERRCIHRPTVTVAGAAIGLGGRHGFVNE